MGINQFLIFYTFRENMLIENCNLDGDTVKLKTLTKETKL